MSPDAEVQTGLLSFGKTATHNFIPPGKTRNPKPETGNPKPEIRNPKN
jgi:hypothetical protein